jgi:predicted dehydrogenase
MHLGVIGLSPGNGHPYSWSAIFNGYDRVLMEDCGFPVIPRYLERQHFPQDAIQEAKVTHVWAQDEACAQHIALAAKIDHVVHHYTDMIGKVDGILLARDDADAHLDFARPFLDAGLPIYIDKPLALSSEIAQQLINMQRYPGQLFSCSALRYAREFQLSEATCSEIGEIRQIHATAPKDWDKYAVHVIEPLLLLAPNRGTIKRIHRWRCDDSVSMHLLFESGLQAQVCTLGASAAPLSLRVIGDRGWRDLVFVDSFTAFRAALNEFVQGVLKRDVRIPPEFMLEVAGIIEAGRTM